MRKRRKPGRRLGPPRLKRRRRRRNKRQPKRPKGSRLWMTLERFNMPVISLKRRFLSAFKTVSYR